MSLHTSLHAPSELIKAFGNICEFPCSQFTTIIRQNYDDTWVVYVYNISNGIGSRIAVQKRVKLRLNVGEISTFINLTFRPLMGSRSISDIPRR
jgi:hypothetical protein